MSAYGVGHKLDSEDAHVAVVALDNNGHRYLCDLGDQWLQPILLDQASPMFSPEPVSGFIPAAMVQVAPGQDYCVIHYHRPNGKISQQHFDLGPIEPSRLIAAGEFSQNSFHKPLVEMRMPLEQEIAHWEFYGFKSWLSTSRGLIHDQPAANNSEWADRI